LPVQGEHPLHQGHHALVAGDVGVGGNVSGYLSVQPNGLRMSRRTGMAPKLGGETGQQRTTSP
jgi:hypothetical protein